MKKTICMLFLLCALCALLCACVRTEPGDSTPTGNVPQENTPTKPVVDNQPPELEFFPLEDETYAVAIGAGAALEEIVFPATHEGKAVTAIVHGTVDNRSTLPVKKITVPSSVAEIGPLALSALPALTEIVFEENSQLQSIGERALADCDSLASIALPASVTSIGKEAFYYCIGLSDIVLSANLTELGEGTFRGCISLSGITLPTGITSIGTATFSDCDSLSCITIPDGVTSIGNSAFAHCYNLSSVYMPAGVTSICDNAFYNCSSLSSIEIPASISSIGQRAFFGCYRLLEVYDLSSLGVTAGTTDNGHIGYYALDIYTTEAETSRYFTDENGYTFYDTDTDRFLVCYSGSEANLSLPADYKGAGYSIYQYAFYRCYSVRSVTIPAGVAGIGKSAFSGCTGLTAINFNATAMADLRKEDTPFHNMGMGNAVTVTVGANVTRIPAYLFSSANITTLRFDAESQCGEIGAYAFPIARI